MEVINKLDFFDLFEFAEKRFGIEHNDANKLFFGNGQEGYCLNYKSYNEYTLDDLAELANLPEDVEVADVSDEDIMKAGRYEKPFLIIGRFLLDNDVKEVLITNG